MRLLLLGEMVLETQQIDNLIVIDKSVLEQEIKDKKSWMDTYGESLAMKGRIDAIESILKHSKPLKPFIEDAFDAGKVAGVQFGRGIEDKFPLRHQYYDERKSDYLNSITHQKST